MAVVKLFVLITSFTGHFGDRVYYKRMGKDCSREWIEPPDPKTDLQQKNRVCFAMAVRSWQALSPDEKAVYAIRATHLNMSGYNLYVKEYMKTGISWKQYYTANTTGAETAPLQYHYCRCGLASPSLLLPVEAVSDSLPLRFIAAPYSIYSLSGCILEQKNAAYGENEGEIPP